MTDEAAENIANILTGFMKEIAELRKAMMSGMQQNREVLLRIEKLLIDRAAVVELVPISGKVR